MKTTLRVTIIAVLVLCLSACGGGGSRVQDPSTPPLSTFTITTSSLPPATQATPYATTLATSGGTGPVVWSITQGSLPANMGLDGASGQISGMPTVIGTSNFTVAAQDSSDPPRTASRDFSIEVNAPTSLTITTLQLPTGFLNVPYSFTMSAAGGSPPYTWSMSPDPMFGLTMSSSGVLSGTPTTGAATVTVSVTDSQNTTVQRPLDVIVNETFRIFTKTLLDGSVGAFYTETVGGTGGTSPYAFEIASGSLPPGLSISGFGSGFQLSGTPTAQGTFSFTVSGTDSSAPQQSDTEDFTIEILPAQLAINTGLLPTGYVGVNYVRVLSASGGTGTLSWSATNLPPGISITTAGIISGTPTTAGSFTLNATVVDSGNPQQTNSRFLDVRIGADLGRNDTIATATLLTNGNFPASLSPISDPPGGLNPDVDVYAILMTGGGTVTIEIEGERIGRLIDSVIEIVDASNVRQSTCDTNNDSVFADSCMNDDHNAGGFITLDSRLVFRVPGSGVQTFYVRVLDWRGDARPELRYNISISGAN